MKISAKTLAILKNFSRISKNLLIRPGNVLTILQDEKVTLAQATVDEVFPQEFVINRLDTFLSAFSLMSDPDVEFEGNIVSIREGKREVTLPAGEKSTIVVPPEKGPQLGQPMFSCELSEDDYKKLMQAAGVLSAPEVVVYSKGGKVYISAKNESVSKDTGYSFEVGESDEKFRAILNVEHLTLMNSSYVLEIHVKGDAGLAKFSGDVTYWIPCGTKSKF